MLNHLLTRKRRRWRCHPVVLSAILLVTLTCATDRARAVTATMDEAKQVCRNWLSYIIHETGEWAGDAAPGIAGSQEIIVDDVVLGYCFTVDPMGYVVVPILKEMAPVKAYSESCSLDVDKTVGFSAFLKGALRHVIELYMEKYNSLDAVQPDAGEVLLQGRMEKEWERFLRSDKEFVTDLKDGKLPVMLEDGPLLSTSWCQTAPYNNSCPQGDGAICAVGCVATAAAQIMKYWNWPTYGSVDEFTYNWDGDQSCGDTTSQGDTLTCQYQDSYDWQNMPDDCHDGCSQVEQDALAELSYEVAVACMMDFGACGSGTSLYRIFNVYPSFFWYSNSRTIDRRAFYDSTGEGWWNTISAEIVSGRPVQYFCTFYGSDHSIVCDGARTVGDQYEYHMNYGWDDGHTAWYVVDNLLGSSAADEQMIRGIYPRGRSFIFGEVYDGSGGPLTPEGSIYIVPRDAITVPFGKVLTIKPGTRIDHGCDISGYRYLYAKGKVKAEGEIDDPISLLSMEPSLTKPAAVVKLSSQLRLGYFAYLMLAR
jgi:hypothetical protein